MVCYSYNVYYVLKDIGLIISFNPHYISIIRFFMYWINRAECSILFIPDKKNSYLRGWGINFWLTGKFCYPLFCIVDPPHTSLFACHWLVVGFWGYFTDIFGLIRQDYAVFLILLNMLTDGDKRL